MTARCQLCDDTGSLSKDIEGLLDCAACDVALQRVALENWAAEQKLECSVSALWVIYNRGVRTGKQSERAPAGNAVDLSDEQIQAIWDEACVCTPQKPGWNRHIRYARAILEAATAPAENAGVRPGEAVPGEVRIDAFGLPFIVPASEGGAATLLRLGRGAGVQIASSTGRALQGIIGVSAFGVPYVSPKSKADEAALTACGKDVAVTLAPVGDKAAAADAGGQSK